MQFVKRQGWTEDDDTNCNLQGEDFAPDGKLVIKYAKLTSVKLAEEFIKSSEIQNDTSLKAPASKLRRKPCPLSIHQITSGSETAL